jgi:hypothetical protein
MTRVVHVAALSVLGRLAGCGRLDGLDLQTIACQQVAITIVLQSEGQIDALHKAISLATGVDPIGTCRELGVRMEPSAPGAGAAGGEAEEGEQEGND